MTVVGSAGPILGSPVVVPGLGRRGLLELVMLLLIRSLRCCWLLLAVLTTMVSAQSPLTTTFASNNVGSVGGMVFFDLDVTNPAGITVKQLDIHTTSPAGILQVFTAPGSYVGIAASPLAWTEVAAASIDPAGMNQPSVVCLGSGFFLPFGSHAIALVGSTLSMRYTDGSTIPLVYANADATLTAGAAASTPFGGLQFAPRVWNGNVHYEVGATTTFSCAYTTSFGVGCNEGATTWYEAFADLLNFDWIGTTAAPVGLQATAIADAGYLLVAQSASWQPPATFALLDNNASSPGAISSNELSEPLQLPFTFPFPGGATNVLHASANGWLLLAATSSQYSFELARADNLLNGPPRLSPFWCVMDPSGNLASNPASGIYFDVDASGTSACITWFDVADARTGVSPAGTSSINVQCVLHSNGDYEFRYGEVVPGSGIGPVLLGWSQGGTVQAVPDPGSIDTSSQAPWVTNGPDNFALVHQAGPSRLGANVVLSVQHVESLAPIAFLMVGDTAFPNGFSLAAAGAPGCFAFANVVVSIAVPVTGTSGNGGLSLSIPNNVVLLGAEIVSQYASLTLRNALNVSTSNAIRGTIGN